MAGDKRTILDVVKAVDEKEFLKEERESYNKTQESLWPSDMTIEAVKNVRRALKGDLRTPSRYKEDLYLQEKNKEYLEIPSLVGKAMSEESPTTGGTYKGSVYFSNILPEGKGDIIWTKEAANIIEKASQTRAKKSDILAAQNYFAKIGYMHPSEVDGMPGRQFRGMVSRWNKNATKSTDAIFDAMETWKDNIFGGDE